MLKELLKDWKGEIEIADKHYTSVNECAKIVCDAFSDDTHIKLYANAKNATQTIPDTQNEQIQYRVTVKKYMTEQATPRFDFMAKWNSDNPMPLRTMTGTIEKETRGMIYMRLHGQAEPVVRCMRCGRVLSNPVSQHYGIGPECMSKLGLIRDIEDVENIKQDLVNIIWEGWIIKSAIVEKVQV